MNNEEYIEKINQIKKEDKPQNNDNRIPVEPQNNNISVDTIKNAQEVQEFSPEDIDNMIKQTQELITPEEKDKLIEEDEKEEILNKFGGQNLSNVPELRELISNEEYLRLGTNARYPVPLEVNGTPVKVFIRALSKKEFIQCRNNARNNNTDVEYEAILKVCTDSHGKQYTEKDLKIFGYGHMQKISEAIMILSGESVESTKTAMQERLINEFLEKFTPQTAW